MTFDGLAGDTTTTEQIANRFGGPTSAPEPTVPLRFDVEFSMTVDPWPYDAYEADGIPLGTEHRYEQLCTAEGEVEISGTTIPLKGGGLRIRRKGTMERSDYSDWMGHVWMSAQFASGSRVRHRQLSPISGRLGPVPRRMGAR